MAETLGIIIGKFDEAGKWVPNASTTGKDKVAAYNALADRAFGRPIQAIVNSELEKPPINDAEVSKIRDAILAPFKPQQPDPASE